MKKVYRTAHFSPETDPMFASPDNGKGGLSIPLLIVLEVIRMHFNAPVEILSGARWKEYNTRVGGAKNSEHKVDETNPFSDAADIRVKGVSTTELYKFIVNLPFANLLGVGKYVKDKFVHVDTRGYPARWNG